MKLSLKRIHITIYVLLFTLGIMGCSSSRNMNLETNESSGSAIHKSENEDNMKNTKSNFTKSDVEHLKHCLALAKEAFEAGDEPFGSILVNKDNKVIATARNRVNEINNLAHPEIELAHWAAKNLSKEERSNITMYTSGEHCPMCAAAHAWVGLGEIVYLSSAAQLGTWLEEVNAEAAPLNFIAAEKIIKNTSIRGPYKGELLEGIKNLQLKYHKNN